MKTRHYGWLAAGILAIAASGFISGASADDAVAHWQVLGDKSTIEWTADYGGKPVTGSFPAFTAEIAFDPEHLDASNAVVKIEMAKVKSADNDAQENLPTSDWFASSQYPLAVFEASSFTHVKDDNFEAAGTLTIRGKAVKVTLPFTVKFYDDKDTNTRYARIQGETSVKRLDFGVGQGDWSKPDAIADAVKIVVRLEAKQAP